MVTYNSAAVVAQALRPLAGTDEVEIIVVDNNSVDATVDVVSTTVPTARIVRRKDNVGFAKAANEGAALATGETVLLLNPDAMISLGTLLRLQGQLDRDPKIGIIAPILETPGADFKTLNAGYAPTIWRMLAHGTGMSRLGGRFSGHYLMDGQAHGNQEVEWVTGGCMLVRNSVWRELSGLTERWFMYAEDVEFCLRAGDRGWHVILVSREKATHAIGGSSAGVDGRVNTMWIEHLYDLYQSRYNAGTTRSNMWRSVVSLGYLLRETYFGARLATDREQSVRAQHLGQKRRFGIYRRALWSEADPKP